MTLTDKLLRMSFISGLPIMMLGLCMWLFNNIGLFIAWGGFLTFLLSFIITLSRKSKVPPTQSQSGKLGENE